MAWTRLIHVASCTLREWPIDGLPPFIAASHAWSDALFPPGVPFPLQAGSQAIKCVLGDCLSGVEYCWIDTFCIDQNDAEDKKRQVPLMGEIYGKAVAVAIVFKTSIGLTQERVGHVSRSVEGAVEMFREERWKEEGKKWELDDHRRRCLKNAMDCLTLLTKTPWATRVWTLQEFVLAKAIIWIGADLIPLRINEELFVALPDVCETLNISECIMGDYKTLYQYYRGMAGAKLGMIDRTRVMELLGNRTASLAVDEVFGTMAASGVVVDQLDVENKEEAWRLWWEKALTEGHVRWALLPPTSPSSGHTLNDINCAMPSFAARHLASSGSGLDSITPLGPVKVDDAGAVTLTGRWVGVCKVTCRLGRVHQDASGLLHRDLTLIFFTSNKWTRALRVARAFGGGRYTSNKIMIIAQILKHNFHRAQMAVLSGTESEFKPRFRNSLYQYIWSDFMLLQSVQMMVMNEGIAFLAEIRNDECSIDIAIVIGTDELPSGTLLAIDFGAITTSGRILLTIVELSNNIVDWSCPAEQGPPPAHKVGVTLAMQCTDLIQAKKYSALTLSNNTIYEVSMGGQRCFRCGLNGLIGEGKKIVQTSDGTLRRPAINDDTRRLLFLKIRRQNQAMKKGRAKGSSSSRRRQRRSKNFKLLN